MNNIKQTHHTSFLPDFCNVRIVFVAILLGELLAIVLTLASYDNLTGQLDKLALISLFIQWISLSCIAVLCLIHNWLNRLPDYWAASLSYSITLLVSLLVIEITWQVSRFWEPISDKILADHLIFLGQFMGIAVIVNALYLRYFYIQYHWRKNIKSEARAQMQALQSRIRPHFFFNCMNTIASLTRKQPKSAEIAIEDLAELFRVSLRDAKRLFTLDEEFSLCQRYLHIESHRLGKRLQLKWEIDALPKDAKLPALTLQPLLENAIYHGIETLPEGGLIQIIGYYQNSNIIIKITNPLAPNSDMHQHVGNQIAQDNIQLRLNACFNNKSTLSIEKTEKLYSVQVKFPYQP